MVQAGALRGQHVSVPVVGVVRVGDGVREPCAVGYNDRKCLNNSRVRVTGVSLGFIGDVELNLRVCMGARADAGDYSIIPHAGLPDHGLLCLGGTYTGNRL